MQTEKLGELKLYDGYVVFNCDLPAWGAVETSAAQHWDNDKEKIIENSTADKSFFWTFY